MGGENGPPEYGPPFWTLEEQEDHYFLNNIAE